MKENKKKIIISVVEVFLFLALAAGLVAYLVDVFAMEDYNHAEQVFNGFYDQPEDSLDGIYIGSSASYRYWIPTEAYDKYGMKIYCIGTAAQPIVLQKYIIKEALKTQPDMDVILLDIRRTRIGGSLGEADMRRVTDNMEFSDNRTEAINAALTYYRKSDGQISYNKNYYYFPFLLYHSRWADDFTLEDLNPADKDAPFMGYMFDDRGTVSKKNIVQPTYTTETTALEPQKKKALIDLLKYCGTLKQKVIFVSSPYRIPKAEQEAINESIKIIKSYGFDVLNYNTDSMTKAMNLDWSTDFMNGRHLNYVGASKYTASLASYLEKHVDFTISKNKTSTELWKAASKNLKKTVRATYKRLGKEIPS